MEIFCNSECDKDGNDCLYYDYNYYCNNPYDRYPNCEGNPNYISDNDCDDQNNNVECDYDGGDCCNRSWIGDGECDSRNNFRSCGNFDGGDCWGIWKKNHAFFTIVHQFDFINKFQKYCCFESKND